MNLFYLARSGGCSTGVGTIEGSLIGDSGCVGVIFAPASFAVLKVVPGGVGGGRLSTIRLVWSTTSIMAIEMAATITAITAGFRRALSIPVNALASAEFRIPRDGYEEPGPSTERHYDARNAVPLNSCTGRGNLILQSQPLIAILPREP